MKSQISLNILVRRFWKKTLVTWVMVVCEGLILLVMPLVIGWAVDDLMHKDVLLLHPGPFFNQEAFKDRPVAAISLS